MTTLAKRIAFGLASLVAAASLVPARAAGFAIFEQGTKAMGLAGAFTAQADDPSAMFHNVGGLGLLGDTWRVSLGGTAIWLGDSTFRGFDPSPGAAATGDQHDRVIPIVHLYYTQPIARRWTFGLSVNSPFGLATEWDDPDHWSGRFISERAELRTLDLGVDFGVKATDTLGVGFGLMYRGSDVKLKRRQAAVDPFTLSAVEIAKVRLDSDIDYGLGWTVGILHRPAKWVSWGASYRSKIGLDYGGTARLTQVPSGDPVFDAIVATQLPFDTDIPVTTRIEFPPMASVGAAWSLSDSVVLETDVNWTGWHTFQNLDIQAPDPSLSESIPENWHNAFNYRAGLRWTANAHCQYRFGVYYDETPQPSRSVSPLLPDASRTGVTFGYGHTWKKTTLDLALLYVNFQNRSTTDNRDGFNGSYNQATWLLGATVGF